jgi:hypothetical protein
MHLAALLSRRHPLDSSEPDFIFYQDNVIVLLVARNMCAEASSAGVIMRNKAVHNEHLSPAYTGY